MKKTIFLFSFILLLGCAGRSSKTNSKKKLIEAEISENIHRKVKSDSLQQKEEKIDSTKSTQTRSNQWRYTAPEFPCNNQNTFIKPFWLMIDGDSINVADMPAGASLENMDSTSLIQERYSKTIKELNRKISDLEEDLTKKAKVRIVEKEKIKEVERQSLQWLLICLAFLLGRFLPTIIKSIWKSIKPI